MHFDLSDQYHHRLSIIHNLDPRVKVVVTLIYVLAVGLTPEGEWWAFFALWIFLMLANLASGLGPTFSLRRSYIAAPFMLIAIPVLFTTPGSDIVELPFVGWTISDVGLVRFLSILLRSWLAVQGAILLTATTRAADLFWALEALRMPKSLVATIRFMYRYLFVLGDEALRLIRARSSRSARLPGNPRPSVIWEGKVAGLMVGSLFIRSLERSERVYAAMLSRGYDGRMRSMTDFHTTKADWMVILLVMLFIGAIEGFAHLG
ncbi:MAG: cobalt ECF transporter T component CbiQ [Anaerolineales bacterium]|nr:cobalt ECF transporter T component CbiQ [Anaerolineales bacterium]